MTGDTGERFLLERQPRPAPAFEKLKEYLGELASRSGSHVRVTLTLDAAAWRAMRADFERPRHHSPQTMTVCDSSSPSRWTVTFEREPPDPSAPDFGIPKEIDL